MDDIAASLDVAHADTSSAQPVSPASETESLVGTGRSPDAPGTDLATNPEYMARTPLERPWVKHDLINDLAMGKESKTTLAEKYGVSRVAIYGFLTRHAIAINARRAHLDDQFSALWIADKARRLAVYEQTVENLADNPDPSVRSLVHQALRNAAEELGHLPNRTAVNVDVSQVSYTVVGISEEDLP